MKIVQKVSTVLTVTNTVLLLLVLAAQLHAGEATPAAPVLRGRMLEIVDQEGRVRASIKVQKAEKHKGVQIPETVMLRLIDQNGRPEVKLGATTDGAGLTLLGISDPTQIKLHASGKTTSIKLLHEDGKSRIIEP